MPVVLTGAQLVGRLARIGPHFAVETYPGGSAPVGGWRPFGELVDSSGVLADRVAEVRAALAAASGQHPGEVERRVAVSVAQLALTARLVCPVLGVAVLTGRLLPLDPVRIRWRPAPDGAVALAVPDDAMEAAVRPSAAAAGAAATDLAMGVAGGVLAGPVRALVEASSRFAVSPQVLWGNVASVVNGSGTLIGTAVPPVRARAHELVAALLDQPPLRGTHHGDDSGFRRRSCCLVYRLAAPSAGPGRAICGDCVLNPPGLGTAS